MGLIKKIVMVVVGFMLTLALTVFLINRFFPDGLKKHFMVV